MPYLLMLFILLPCLSKADNHILMPIVSFHLDQKTLPGYGLSYQFKFSESFEFDAAIIDSNDLHILQTNEDISGRYTSVFIGTTFLKPYNDDLTIKAGVGMFYSLSSGNQQLIANNQVSPYIKISAKYRLSPHLNIEIGQISVFSTGALGNNHSLFFGLAWAFGTTNSSSLSSKNETINKQPLVEKNQPQKLNIPVKVFTPLNLTKKKWIVQFAAYQDMNNANKKLLTFQKLFDNKGFNTRLVVVKTNKLYKLITSKVFIDKSKAKVVAKNIYDLFAIKSFVASTSRPISIND